MDREKSTVYSTVMLLNLPSLCLVCPLATSLLLLMVVTRGEVHGINNKQFPPSYSKKGYSSSKGQVFTTNFRKFASKKRLMTTNGRECTNDNFHFLEKIHSRAQRCQEKIWWLQVASSLEPIEISNQNLKAPMMNE